MSDSEEKSALPSPTKAVPQPTILTFKSAKAQRPASRSVKKLFVTLYHPHTKEVLISDFVNNQDQLDDILSQVLESEGLSDFLPSKRAYTSIIRDKFNPLERLCDGFVYLILEMEGGPPAKRKPKEVTATPITN
jgi:hypothetical protein